MDTTTVQILDLLSSNIGNSLSINQLTKQIKDTYGSAHYANIYQKLQELKNEGLLTIDPVGKSSNPKLNFQSYLLIDKLAEMELEKKIAFLENRANLFPFLSDLDRVTSNQAIKSIIAINPLRNIKLNSIELFFLLTNSDDQAIEHQKQMEKMQSKYNIKISSIFLTEKSFSNFCTSDEINPLREGLSNQINLFGPQAFWREIKQVSEHGQLQTLTSLTKPADISETDLTYNLNRFGYREFGTHLVEGKKFCIEYITTALLLQEEARKLDAIAVILIKNSFSSDLLVFLSQKFEATAKLAAILKTLEQIPNPEIAKTIHILNSINTQEYHIDRNSIQEQLRTYNAL
jgi:hypothetical protein